MLWIKVSAAFGFLSVALGAFGGHMLKGKLSPDRFEIFQIGLQYQIFHTLALLALSLYAYNKGTSLNVLGGLFTAGILVFSGSLYTLSLSGIKSFGAITPIGGVLFLIGWGLLFFKGI